MTDVVSKEARSRMMSGIRSKDTKPELFVRQRLHRKGLRFRLHDRRLPGKPDLVLRKHNVVVFVHGCFWHEHNCHLFKWPRTKANFWRRKISGNAVRDKKNERLLLEGGWRVATVWECALKGRTRVQRDKLFEELVGWIESGTEPRWESRLENPNVGTRRSA